MTGSTEPRLVVVDDEAGLREMLADYLGSNGFSVRLAEDGRALDRLLADQDADMVLLDVNMPGEDGFAIARRLRAESNVAIVMLTSADDVIDRVVGLEIGADDYVTKPFDLRELRTRLRTVLRRVELTREAPQPDGQASRLVPFGKVSLDIESRALVYPNGTRERLTVTELDLLSAFAESPNKVLSRDELLDRTSHRELEPFDRSIDIRIARIRRKIGDDAASPQIIRTVRGAGYIYVPPKSTP